MCYGMGCPYEKGLWAGSAAGECTFKGKGCFMEDLEREEYEEEYEDGEEE